MHTSQVLKLEMRDLLVNNQFGKWERAEKLVNDAGELILKVEQKI